MWGARENADPSPLMMYPSIPANFLLQADDQAMPSRIVAKVHSRPSTWNTWSGRVPRVTTRNRPFALPAPDFLPGPTSDTLPPLTDEPRVGTFSLASHPLPKRAASQISAEEEQHTKKPKVQAQEEDERVVVDDQGL